MIKKKEGDNFNSAFEEDFGKNKNILDIFDKFTSARAVAQAICDADQIS